MDVDDGHAESALTTTTNNIALNRDVLRHIASFMPPLNRTRLCMVSTETRSFFTVEDECKFWRRVIRDRLHSRDPEKKNPYHASLEQHLGAFWNTDTVMELWCYYWIVSAGSFEWLLAGKDVAVGASYINTDGVGNPVNILKLFHYGKSRRKGGGVRFAASDFRLGPLTVAWRKRKTTMRVSPTLHVNWPICGNHHCRTLIAEENARIPLLNGPLDMIRMVIARHPWWIQCDQRHGGGREDAPERLVSLPIEYVRHRESLRIRAGQPWEDSALEYHIHDLARKLEWRHRRLTYKYRKRGERRVNFRHVFGLSYATDVPAYGNHGHNFLSAYLQIIERGYGFMEVYRYSPLRATRICSGAFVAFMEWLLTVQDEPPNTRADLPGPPPVLFVTVLRLADDILTHEWLLDTMKWWYMCGGQEEGILETKMSIYVLRNGYL